CARRDLLLRQDWYFDVW
nr:immunoglobulin heavy chain junction region [Mus musculus]MBK4195166.1 immunoglobulin heavy chain junction region [Mus musculus]